MQKILMLIPLLFLVSCEQDFDIPNPNEPNVEIFWETGTHAEQGVNAIYSTFKRGGISRWMPMLYDIRSDVGESRSPWPELNNAIDKFIQPDYNFGPVVDVYRDLYIGIFRCNQVLDNVPAIEMEATQKNRLLGEAQALRGLFYYHLANLWGNVPLMLAASQPTDLPPTASQAEVWAQVVTDLQLAADLLPATYSDPEDIGRVTRGASLALLAKAQMQQGNYQAAKDALDWMVTGAGAGNYALMGNYADNFTIFSENNAESVLEIQFADNPLEFTDNDVQTINHNYGTSVAQFFAPVGIGFSDGEARRWVTREFLREQTTDGQRDPRLAVSFLYDSTNVDGPQATLVYGQPFSSRYSPGSPDFNRVWFRKFLNDHHKNEEGFRSENNYRFIRYADVLLMYAECLNQVGLTAEAYQYVDRVRERAGLAPLSIAMPGLSQSDFLEQIKHERLLELTGEGHRWTDLVRWGDLGPGLADQDPAFAGFEVGKHEFLPIPQRDLDINSDLTQNPGW